MATSAARRTTTEDRESSPFIQLRLFLVAIGIAGLLATIGFICSFARDDFLGIGVGVRSSYDLTSLAGTFTVQTVLVLLQQLLKHWIVTVIMLAACLLSLVHNHIASTSIFSHRIVQLGIVTGIAVVATANLFLLYLPLVNLKDALITGLETLTIREPAGVVACGTNKYWELIIDSRRPTESSPDPISKVYSSCIERRGSEAARNNLHALYTYGFTFCCAGWFMLYFNRSGGQFGLISGVLIALSIVVLGVNSLFIPYMFGKVIQPTIMPKAQVSSKQPEERYAWDGPLLIISESDKSILGLLLDKKSGNSHIVEIPRELVNRINISQTSDVLQERIDIWRSQIEVPIQNSQGVK